MIRKAFAGAAIAALLGTATIAQAAPQRAEAPVSGEESEISGIMGALIAVAIVAALVLVAMELDGNDLPTSP